MDDGVAPLQASQGRRRVPNGSWFSGIHVERNFQVSYQNKKLKKNNKTGHAWDDHTPTLSLSLLATNTD